MRRRPPLGVPFSRRRRLDPARLPLVALVALTQLPACQRIGGRAIGRSGELTIVTDYAADAAPVAAAREVLGREIVTVRPEAAFEIDTAGGDRFPEIKAWRNLVLVANLSRSGPAVERVKDILGKGLAADFTAGRRVYSLFADVWTRGQTVLVLAGTDDAALAAAIRAQGDRIFTDFDQAVTRQIVTLGYLGGEQDVLRRHLERQYGWSIRIPEGYRVGEDSAARFVRFFRREGGAHLMFVHWTDGSTGLPSGDSCLAIRERLVHDFYDGDVNDPERTHVERVDFLGRHALKLIGVWQNAKYTIGGPFRTYCFFDDERFTMIDLAVFDPVNNKVELLRQLEAIALTYRDQRR